MAQDKGNIDLIDNIYLTFFARDFRQAAYDDAVYQLIAHFAGKFGGFKMLLDVPYKQQLADDTQLRILEKESQHTEKSITNLLTAIEAGIFTDSTKSRLQELEEKKKELEEKILVGKSIVKASISRDEIETYLKYAILQSPKPLLDLLLQKVVVYKDRIKIYMKCVGDTPSDDSPDENDTPDGTDSVRGLLILSYSIQIDRKLPHGGRGKKRNYITQIRDFSIELYL